MHSVGVHTEQTAVANFYNGPVKKLMKFVMRRKNAYLKVLGIIFNFCFVFKLNGGLMHIVCRFLFRLILFMLVLLLLLFERL